MMVIDALAALGTESGTQVVTCLRVTMPIT